MKVSGGNLTTRISGRAHPVLDAMKFLMAFLVVEIHTKPLGVPEGLAGALLLAVEGLAAPFFFIASGFLCIRKADVEDFVAGGLSEAVPRMLAKGF